MSDHIYSDFPFNEYEIDELKEVNGALLAACKAIKNLLNNGEYAVCHKDGSGMGLGAQIVVGEVFEQVDAAIAKAEGE